MIVKIVLGVVLAAIVGFIVLVAVQPSEFSVSRSATIDAPVDQVFPLINDFHEWEAWSPWAKLDPNARNAFSGPQAGKGATFAWDGDKNVGKGSQVIVESIPNEKVEIDLTFEKPMPGEMDVTFTFEPVGEQTKVTWASSSEQNFLGKAMGLFFDCEKMIGDPFEQGLANINTVAAGAKETTP